jgi:hypothetical protein
MPWMILSWNRDRCAPALDDGQLADPLVEPGVLDGVAAGNASRAHGRAEGDAARRLVRRLPTEPPRTRDGTPMNECIGGRCGGNP